MRVLLAPFETAGVAGALAGGLRRRGHDAELAVLEPHPFGFPHDRLIGRGYGSRARFAIEALRRYHVLHFQYGTTPLEFIDAAAARVTTRPLMLMHYWGDDARTRDVAERHHPARARVWDAVPNRDEATVRRRMRVAARLCRAAVVSDLELASYVAPRFRTVYVMPTAIDPRPVAAGPLPSLEGAGPVVLHAPSETLIKGTAEIRDAVADVAARRPLRPRWLQNSPHSEVLAEIARADVVIDQLNSETTGLFALEAMAVGKPVLVEFRHERLAPFARDSPAVPVTSATLSATLEALLDDQDRREALGRAGREFVERVHDADLVAAAAERMYHHAPEAGAGVFEVTHDRVRRLPSPPA